MDAILSIFLQKNACLSFFFCLPWWMKLSHYLVDFFLMFWLLHAYVVCDNIHPLSSSLTPSLSPWTPPASQLTQRGYLLECRQSTSHCTTNKKERERKEKGKEEEEKGEEEEGREEGMERGRKKKKEEACFKCHLFLLHNAPLSPMKLERASYL